MRVVISNFGRPGRVERRDGHWARAVRPPSPEPIPLFAYKMDWGFHLFALGMHLRDESIAEAVEFWDFSQDDGIPGHRRGAREHYTGVLRVNFLDELDVFDYVARFGAPDLYVHHGRNGAAVLEHLQGRSFRVRVPASRHGLEDQSNHGAECYLVDDARFLDDYSMLYIPVVNTERIRPVPMTPRRDFVYLAWPHPSKRHDIAIEAARRHGMSGHLHPVPLGAFDLGGLDITTSDVDERDVLELLCSSRIAVYPGDNTSNPAAMWECVAAGLPIVVNENILGGHHLVVPGVTGELAREERFGEVMCALLESRASYAPREHFEHAWDTRAVLNSYLEFFVNHGLGY